MQLSDIPHSKTDFDSSSVPKTYLVEATEASLDCARTGTVVGKCRAHSLKKAKLTNDVSSKYQFWPWVHESAYLTQGQSVSARTGKARTE